MKQMVSLKEIANRAQLSKATVSRALRNHEDISLETRERVQQIASELMYRPNLLAQSMHTGKTGLAGLIIPEGAEKGDFCVRIIYGIHKELLRHDYVPITLWTKLHSDGIEDGAVKSQIHQLIDRRVDGIIVIPTMDARDAYIKEIVERHIPLTMVDLEVKGLQADFVGTDDVYGASLAADYLVRLGHRRLLHIGGPMTASTAWERRRGFEAVIQRAGLKAEYVEDPFYGNDVNMSMHLARRILTATDRPTAIFCGADTIACGVYKVAQDLNLHIPRDLSVVGYADLTIAQLMHPSLTTVRQDPYEIGAQAARLLMLRSKYNTGIEPQKTVLKPELVIRDSAGPYHQRTG